MMKRMMTVTIAGLLLLLLAAIPVSAQETNLLTDPGLENEQFLLMSAESSLISFSVPYDWRGGVILSPQFESWMNQHPTGYPHTSWIKREGGRSLHIARGGATFTAFVYQQVSVAEGSPVRGGAWAYIEGNPTGIVRAGIDPTGSTNPYSPDIVWSAWGTVVDNWNFVEAQTVARTGTVTLFLWAQQSQPTDPNGVYWDDAFLFGTAGAGNIAAPEAAAPEAAPVASGERSLQATTRLNVRGGPGTGFGVQTIITPGTDYAILDEQAGWYQIAYGASTGWVSASFVNVSGSGNISAPVAAGEIPPATGVTFESGFTLNLRSAPTTRSEVLAKLPFNTVVDAVGRSADSNWVQVVYNGQAGWVAAWLGGVRGGRFSSLPVR